MKKAKLPMMNVLHGGYIFTLFVFWIVTFILIPSLQPLLSGGLWSNLRSLSWIDLACTVFNGISLALILKEYLGDSFFDVQICPRLYVSTIVPAVLTMLVWVFAVMRFGMFISDDPLLAFNYFPLAEFSMTMVPGLLVQNNPVIATLVLSLFAPFAICGLFYANTFAPLCSRHPVLGYLGVTLLLLVTSRVSDFWYRDSFLAWMTFVVQLPIHLIACWTFQRTDNPWTPIFSLGLFNFISSLLFCLLTFLPETNFLPT